MKEIVLDTVDKVIAAVFQIISYKIIQRFVISIGQQSMESNDSTIDLSTVHLAVFFSPIDRVGRSSRREDQNV